MRRQVWSLGLVLLLVALSGCAVLQKARDLLQPPTPAAAVAVTQGQVRDAITKLPVAGARLQAGTVTALSDIEGAFSIPSLGGDMILITAPGYEALQLWPRTDLPTLIDLVPDATTTFQIIYDYEKRHEFARQYDLLHPDVQMLFGCGDFVRHMEQNRSYDIVDFSVGAADILASGAVLGKVYVDVAQVPVRATVRVDGQITQRAWSAYAAKAGGVWRWFRGPLTWPTPTPTQTPTATATALPTPTFTGTPPLPTATLVPLPTYTPYPTLFVSPTPYEPVLPGSQAVVIADAVGLHTGPGEQYAVAWGIPRGMVVLVLEWPRWVEGLPWYQVRVLGPELEGWCNGAYLAPLVITPTPTGQPLAPAALRLAFTSERDGNREVYVMNPDGTGVHNLTQSSAQDSDPSWAPMHDRLAFVSDRMGNADIFVMNVDGSGLRQITSGISDEIHPAWSPDGALIAYVSNEDGDWEIFVMSASGTGAVQLTANDAWDSYPSWSQDGRKLAFTSDRDGNYELYLYDLETRTETRLTDSATSDAFPAWSPSGNEIAFISARDGPLELYLLNWVAIPHTVTRLTYTVPADAANRYPTWSADGYWLAFTSWRDGNAEIYVIRRDGWGLWNLTRHPANDKAPAWVD